MSIVAITKIGDDIFVALDDIKIAKRGKDGTAQADTLRPFRSSSLSRQKYLHHGNR